LNQIPQKFANSPYLAETYYELGWAKQNQNKLEDALKDYAQAIQKSRGHVGARAQFMIGQVHFAQKKFPEAVRAFKRVMYGYGDRNSAEPVKEWQAMCAYEAGRCAEVQIKNESDAARKAKLIQDAITNYQYVVDRHPQHERAKTAQERIAALSKLTQ
jgi:tetratricopeptide (TPR) repeat protein